MAALRLPIEGNDQMDFLPAAGLPWFVALFGRDSLIVSLQTMLWSTRISRAARSTCWGAGRRRERDDFRDAEPGKILHELRLRRARALQAHPAHALLRHRGRDAALSDHPACRLARDGRPRSARAHLRDRRALSGLDRRIWRPRRGRVSGIRDALAGGLREPGLEGFRRRRRRTPTAAGEGPEGAVRAAGLCVRRLARHGRNLRRAGRAPALRRCDGKADALFTRFNEAFWDEATGFYAFAWTATSAGLDRRVQPGHCLWSGIVPPDRAERVVAAADAAGHVERLGHPHPLRQHNPPLQPLLLPERLGLAARQQPHRARLQALRLRAGGEPGRPGHQPRGKLLRAASVARALCGRAARRDQLPGPVSGRERAAGLGGRIGVLAAAGDARASSWMRRAGSCASTRCCRPGCRT